MKHISAIIVVMFAVFSASPVAADDRDCNVPLANWQPREALQKKVEVDGWKVTRIKTDDGCYKVYAINAKGDRYKGKFNPGTLKLMKTTIEYK